MSSTYTQEQLTALEKAISDGVMEVRYDDKWVKYRSLDEMLRIRDMMKACLAPSPNTCPKTTRIRATFSKGLC